MKARNSEKTFRARVAMVVLVAFTPVALGCADAGAPAAPQSVAGTLEVKGANGKVKSVLVSKEGLDSVVANRDKFRADGVETDDLAQVLTASSIETMVGGKAVRLVRTGNSLAVEGGASSAKVDINGLVFTATGEAGSWECTFNGMSAGDTAKLAGAMALAVLLSSEASLAEDLQQGNCELTCIVFVSIIIIGVFGIGFLIAFAVCKIDGPKACAKAAAISCGAGNVKKANMDCDTIFDFDLKQTNGKTKATGECNFDCKN